MGNICKTCGHDADYCPCVKAVHTVERWTGTRLVVFDVATEKALSLASMKYFEPWRSYQPPPDVLRW